MISNIVAWFALRKFKIFGYVAILAIVSGTIFAGYRYIDNLNDKVIAQAELLVEQKIALESVTNALNLTIENYEQMQQNLDELDKSILEATTGVNDLRRLFADHDLTNLAAEKPGLIERRINEASDQVRDDLERLTAPE